MITIQNKEQLIKNGLTNNDRKVRSTVLGCFEHALNAVDPKQLIKSRLLLKKSILKIGNHVFDLRKFKNVYVIGGGKASGSMTEALEEILVDRITDGTVNVPYSCSEKTRFVKLQKAGHPIPDQEGFEGVSRMLKIAEDAKEDDLIICLISGGGSSLMPHPREDIALDDKRKITDSLLKCGATITEINTVRKHLSDFKGGWLAKKAFPATTLNLILSDVIGDPLEFIASGPYSPDSTTFNEAITVLRKFQLWDTAPQSIKKTLSNGHKGIISETPKIGDPVFTRVHNVLIGNNRYASSAMCEKLRFGGMNSVLLTTTMEGEARHVGVVLASIAQEISTSDNLISKPAGIVAGGETTVTITGKGVGGRNQEIALAAAIKIRGMDRVIVASISTDGIDGPTDAAGAIADGTTISRAMKMNLNPEKFLANNDSYNFFSRLNELIFTGPTQTNVNDISVIMAYNETK
ncbi:MAG: glycerate kinase [Candidatus Bathyarchaeota archaeon]|jgi:glycerate-2-kinase